MAQRRLETEEQQGVSQSVSDPENDSTHEWPEDDEAEYQSPEDDGELSFEDTEAAGATLGSVRVSNTSSQTVAPIRSSTEPSLAKMSAHQCSTACGTEICLGSMPQPHHAASPSAC